MDELDEANNRASKEITVGETLAKPDLALDPSGILFSNDNPTEGEVVLIDVEVYNKGRADAGDFKVEFFVDGVSRANNTLIVGSNSTNTMQFTWTATEGTHEIAIKVDPEDAIGELDESNNNASRQITVSAKTKPQTPEVVLLANSIDYNLSGNFAALLKTKA
jgi:subtilase family serine protease